MGAFDWWVTEESYGTEHLSCKLGKQLPVCMMTSTPLLIPVMVKSSHGHSRVAGMSHFSSVRWKEVWGSYTSWGPHHLPQLHAMAGPVLVCGDLSMDPFLCSLELISLPFLHRPRHPSASRPHSPEPRHSHPCATSTVSSQPDSPLTPPRSSWFQEQPSPNHWDPSPARRVRHYVRKAPALQALACPAVVCAFVPDSSRTW